MEAFFNIPGEIFLRCRHLSDRLEKNRKGNKTTIAATETETKPLKSKK
jgi:hypothetical protein